MDWAMPPGGFEKVFAQYDRIVTRHPFNFPHEPDGPANAPATAAPDEPPWAMPPDVPMSDEKPTYSDGFAKLLGTGALAATMPKALQASDGLEALAEPLLGGAAEAGIVEAGAAIGLLPGLALGAAGVSAFNYLEDNMPKEESFLTPVQPGEVSFEVDGKPVPAKTFHETPSLMQVASQPVSFKRDEQGLSAAYSNPKGTSYDPATQTEYVKGSVNARDFFDDFTKIPFGDTSCTQRYDQGMQAYNELQSSGQPVKRIVGHSLGGSVALEMQQNLEKKGRTVTTRTFGAPVLEPLGAFSSTKSERYKRWLDPVAAFDTGATHGKFKLYPHSFTDYEDMDK